MSEAEARAIASRYNSELQHIEAEARPFRGAWRVMIRRKAGGDWFAAPKGRR